MYLGKTLFAQVMDFLPWKTFHRIIHRYDGDYRTRSLSCAEQFRVMAFAQLTYARYRSVPGSSSRQALPHGHRRGGLSLDIGRCQRIARLADLLRVGSTADHPSSRALR